MGLLGDALSCQQAFPAALVAGAASVAYWATVFGLEVRTQLATLWTLILAIMLADLLTRVVRWILAGGVQATWARISEGAQTKVLSVALSDCAQAMLFLMPVWAVVFAGWRWVRAMWLEKPTHFLCATSLSWVAALLALRHGEEAAVLGYVTALGVVFTPALRHYEVHDRVERASIRGVERAVSGTKSATSGTVSLFVGIFRAVCGAIYGVYDAIKTLVLSVVNLFISIITGTYELVLATGRGIKLGVVGTGQAIVGAGVGIRDTIVGAYRATVATIVNTALAIKRGVVGFFMSIYNGIMWAVTSVRNAVVGFFMGIYNGVVAIVDSVRRAYRYTVECVNGGVDGIRTGIAYACGAFVQWVVDCCVGTRNGVVGGVNAVCAAVVGSVQATQRFVVDTKTRGVTAVHERVGASKRAVRSGAERAKSASLSCALRAKDASLVHAKRGISSGAGYAKQGGQLLLQKLWELKVWLGWFARVKLWCPFAQFCHELKEQIKAHIRDTWLQPLVDYCHQKWLRTKLYVLGTAINAWLYVYVEFLEPAGLWVKASIPERAPYLEGDSDTELMDFLPQEEDDAHLTRHLAKPLNDGDSDSDVEYVFGDQNAAPSPSPEPTATPLKPVRTPESQKSLSPSHVSPSATTQQRTPNNVAHTPVPQKLSPTQSQSPPARDSAQLVTTSSDASYANPVPKPRPPQPCDHTQQRQRTNNASGTVDDGRPRVEVAPTRRLPPPSSRRRQQSDDEFAFSLPTTADDGGLDFEQFGNNPGMATAAGRASLGHHVAAEPAQRLSQENLSFGVGATPVQFPSAHRPPPRRRKPIPQELLDRPIRSASSTNATSRSASSNANQGSPSRGEPSGALSSGDRHVEDDGDTASMTGSLSAVMGSVLSSALGKTATALSAAGEVVANRLEAANVAGVLANTVATGTLGGGNDNDDGIPPELMIDERAMGAELADLDPDTVE